MYIATIYIYIWYIIIHSSPMIIANAHCLEETTLTFDERQSAGVKASPKYGNINLDHPPWGGKTFEPTNQEFSTPNIILAGGFNPSEKYQSIGITIPNIWENKKCSKPPSSIGKPSNQHSYWLLVSTVLGKICISRPIW